MITEHINKYLLDLIASCIKGIGVGVGIGIGIGAGVGFVSNFDLKCYFIS